MNELATSGTVRSRYEPAGTNSLEGLTWPDSYSVEDHESEVDILRTIVRAFDRHDDRDRPRHRARPVPHA